MSGLGELFRGLDHPAVAVSDADAMADWYCDVLGYRRRSGQAGAVWLLESPDGTYLEVMKEDGSPRPDRGTHTPGWSHLALRVSDLDAAIAALDARGVEWTADVVEAVGGGRLRSFADPDGNIWQVVER